jgi:PRC-barrel domain
MTDHEHRSDRFTTVDDQYAGYTVVDDSGSKIGKVDNLFLDENDQPEYFGVKMGFLGTSSTLIPADIATTNNEQGFIEVPQPKSTVQEGPAFNDDREITPDYENEVRSYYGLGPVESSDSYEETNGHSGSGTTDSTTAGTVGSGTYRGRS